MYARFWMNNRSGKRGHSPVCKHEWVRSGGLKKKISREIFEWLRESFDNCRKLIFATGSYIGEGFDEPRL
jgi:hypothetical protein